MNSTTITLSWVPPTSNQTNGYIRHYSVAVTEHDTTLAFQEQSNYTQVTLQSLHPYTTPTHAVWLLLQQALVHILEISPFSCQKMV